MTTLDDLPLERINVLSDITNFYILIDQLDHAVKRAGGKTTITATDIDVLRKAYGHLLRYDNENN